MPDERKPDFHNKLNLPHSKYRFKICTIKNYERLVAKIFQCEHLKKLKHFKNSNKSAEYYNY